ncbi:ACP S-malonyltransferase [Desulfosoma sp.]
MKNGKMCWVFPAFEMKYRAFDPAQLPGYLDCVARCLERMDGGPSMRFYREAYASAKLYSSLSDELKHDLSFVSSCAVADYLKALDLLPQSLAPYSMGLYAALYAAECLPFEDALQLMRFICRTAHEVGPTDGAFGMGVVMGLSEETLQSLLQPYAARVYLSDVVAHGLCILSGPRRLLQELFEEATRRGASHGKFLPVGLPYHSPLMAAAEERIRPVAGRLLQKAPRWPIISCVTQKPLRTVDDVLEEVAANVVRPLHWRRTVQTAAKGIDLFVECGLSEQLCKLIVLEISGARVMHPKRLRSHLHEIEPRVFFEDRPAGCASRQKALGLRSLREDGGKARLFV